ncbi:MAG: thiamine pyrophosphate-binding protein [Candidatus Hydrogenedentes bacterium]|nr:thiamine pyrophosphate-binding protein [Candidatus Hydrogenedentota bacterium]
MEKMLGGDIVARMLKAEGVEKVFGIIDGTYFGFYSSLGKHGIELVTPRHEACAVHAAAAYARLTGKLGVCMASNGPGVANVLPGIAVENGEGNRVLLITSTRRTGIGYPDRGGTYQYFNQVGVIKPMSKWSGAAPSFDRIPEFMKRAFRKSWSGRPGVVHVDIPENLLNSKTEWGNAPEPHTYRRVDPTWPNPEHVKRAAELLVKAQQPLIHAGSGVIHAQASRELQQVAELLQAPVCTSWAARGAMPENIDIAIPMIHVELNHQVRNDADVVLVLGSRLGETDWWGKAPYWRQPADQQMIQVDIDDDILGMNKPAPLNVLADAKVFLSQLRDAIEQQRGSIDVAKRQAALKKYREARQKHRDKLDKSLKDLADPLNTAHVSKLCQEFFDENAILVIDGGNTAIWGNFFHEVRVPCTLLGTPKFGMLGAGVAQAVGAAVACPDRQVYCIIGDGAMGFNQQEVETAVRNNLKIIYIVCADKQWGMVKMNQQFALRPIKTMIKKSLGPDETINADFSEVRFDKLGEAMGAHGERVGGPEDLRPALERAKAAGKCGVIHVDVDPVKHMWAPSLLDFKKMHQEPAGK